MIFSVDEINWNYGCTIERTAEVESSEISGLMLDKSYFNDVIGTYMKYDIRIEVPFGREDEFTDLYEQLTHPMPAHNFVLPYATGTVEIYGRVQNVKDIYLRMKNGKIHWHGIQFSVIANIPTKRMKLNGDIVDVDDNIIKVGFPDLPDESYVNIGTMYYYGLEGWEEAQDADDYYY